MQLQLHRSAGERTQLVRELAPDIAAIARMDRSGVVVTAPGDETYDFVSRYFAPAKGIPEDPVTGGAHCALAPIEPNDSAKQRFARITQPHGAAVDHLSAGRRSR